MFIAYPLRLIWITMDFLFINGNTVVDHKYVTKW